MDSIASGLGPHKPGDLAARGVVESRASAREEAVTALASQSQLIEKIIAHLRLSGGRAGAAEVCRDLLGLANCDEAAARSIVTRGLAPDGRIRVSRSGEVVLVERDKGDPGIAEVSFAVVDVETTGMPSAEHRITEIAVILVDAGEVVDDFVTLVNPGIPIPARIEDLTGISDAMVSDAPPFAEVAAPLLELLGDRVLVAHNSPFDMNFINAELGRTLDVGLLNSALCTVRLSRALVPGLEDYRLDSVARYFGVEVKRRHRALGDAAATAVVFLRLIDLAREKGWTRLSQLQRVAGRRRGPKSPARASERSTRHHRLRG